MREIKFRAWDEYQKKMLDWTDITDPMKLTLSNLLNGLIEHLKPMQYTGLKDKNGKEIYEGDTIAGILKENKSEVYFDIGCFRVEEMSLVSINDKCEIIGNIYENSELIKT